MPLAFVVAATVLAGASGMPGLLLPRTSRAGGYVATGMVCVAAVLALAGIVVAFRGDAVVAGASFPWPAAGRSKIGIDALSAFFLIPVFVLGALGSIYGLGYWPAVRRPASARRLRLVWGTLLAGMAVLVVARHAMVFLLGWEVMALSAFFLIGVEDHRAEARSAAWLYLVSTHVATLALFALFATWRWATGSYALVPVPDGMIGLGTRNALFFLALFGFGLKSGMIPLHFWLPTAHANAPSHVSAVLSGVMIKMGIYGLVRFLSFVPDPPVAWGWLVLALGAASGLVGVVFALGQHDLKRLLAYHSVENVGIILIGLGVALLGRSLGHAEWTLLGLAGCLLHVWNHCLFKSLLFFGAGSVVHAARTREIDRLGGLAKAMPWTAGTFLVGAVAICGLPPLNGFVSELFVYLGLLGTLTPQAANGSAAVLAAPALAAIGTLAVACFVKAYGAVFLGTARTPAAERAVDPPAVMKVPWAALAGACVFIGLFPPLLAPILDAAAAAWTPGLHAPPAVRLADLAPLRAVSAMAIALVATSAAVAGLVGFGRRAVAVSGTWDCGYAAPTSRMQYSASSFAQTLVGLHRWLLRPRVGGRLVQGLHPEAADFHSHVDDAMLDRLLLPAGRAVERTFGWFHRLQGGFTQDYLLYILIAVVVLLSTLLPLGDYAVGMLAR